MCAVRLRKLGVRLLKLNHVQNVKEFCSFLTKPVNELSDKIKPLPAVLPKPAKYIIVRHCFKLKTFDENWNKLDEFKHFKPHDTPLSKIGREQAEHLCDLMKYQNFGRIICSPYRRCIETVLPVARRSQLKICIEPGFSETTKSVEHVDGFESDEILAKDYGSNYFDVGYESLVKSNDLRHVETKIHSTERAIKTMAKILEIFKSDQAVLICTHSTPCGALMKTLCDEIVYFRFGSVSFVYDDSPGKFAYSLLNTLED